MRLLLFLVAVETFFFSPAAVVSNIPAACIISAVQYNNGKSLVCPFDEHCPDRYHSTPMVSYLICNGKFDVAQPKHLHRNKAAHARNETIIKRYVVFKTARTGSHMITNILNDVIAASNRPSVTHFEPFCRDPCYGRATPQEERVTLGMLFRNLLCKENKFQGDNWKCLESYECPHCLEWTSCDATSNHYGSLAPMVGIELNPRFTDRLDWANVLYGSQKPYNAAAVNFTRIFNLRRSNLVRQAYSKRQHGGCSIKRISFGWDNDTYVADNHRWKHDLRHATFNFSMAMTCLEGYSLWEQEYSSSVAVAAAQRQDALMLLLYEDMMADMDLAQQQIALHLRVSLGETVAQRTVKRHSANICNNEDVDCDDLNSRWGNGQYPCLMKQLHDTDEGRAWTVPMFPNGSIHIKGDCHPLRPLDSIRQPRRLYSDLYQSHTTHN